METPNLGPGQAISSAGSPFVISNEAWSKIAQYVRRIDQMSAREVTTVSRYIGALPKLRSASNNWSRRTFPNIVALASKISHYGGVVAPDNLEQLEACLTETQSTDDKTLLLGKVGTLIGNLRGMCREITESAGEIKLEVESFVAASQETQTEYRQFKDGIGSANAGDESGENVSMSRFAEEIAEDIANLVSYLAVFKTAPLVILEKVKGDWDSIDSDLSYTQKWLQQRIDAKLPFLADLEIEAAIRDWQKVADEAQAFINDVPKLERALGA